MIKRILYFLVACSLFVCACGCNGEEKRKGGSVVSGFDLPNYDTTRHIMTYADFPPQPTSEGLDLYKSCGFNTYFLDLNYFGNGNDGFDLNKYFDMVKTVGQKGMDVLIHGGSSFYNGIDFSEYDNIAGFVIMDEPSADQFDSVYENSVTWINNGKQDHLFYINLFPSYASSSLGVYPGGGKSAYENYVDLYYDKVLSKVKGKKQIGFDHYPLKKRSGTYYLSDTYLYDMMTVAQTAKKAKADTFSNCVQAFSDGETRLPETAAEISFQLYTALAFGVNAFEVFIYMPSALYGAMLKDGKPTATWYAVQEALKTIDAFDEIYMNFTWNGVETFFGTSNPEDAYTAHFDYISKNVIDLPGIKEATCTQDTVIGGFNDKFGNNGYMIVNYTDPMNNKFDKVEIEFENVKKVAVYKEGIETKYSISGNKLSFTLIPGEGAFVITFDK